MKFSIFNNVKETTPTNIQVKSFEELCAFVKKSEKELVSKEDQLLFSPGCFMEGKKRSKQNVKECYIIAFDSDDLDCKISDVFSNSSTYRALLYTSFSHKEDHHKFRLILPLSRPVNGTEYEMVWEELVKELGLPFDPAPKHPAALFYLPSYPLGSCNYEFREYAGPVCDPAVLIKRHKKDHEHKKQESKIASFDASPKSIEANFSNKKPTKNFRWMGLNDCPFIKSEKITEYLSLSHGSGSHYNQMWRIACSIASVARLKNYPISSNELAILLFELDNLDGGHHQKRKRDLRKWAENAINKY